MQSMNRAANVAVVCLIVSVAVAADEYSYYHGHPYRHGPSLQIAVLAVVVAVLAGVVAWVAVEVSRVEDRSAVRDIDLGYRINQKTAPPDKP